MPLVKIGYLFIRTVSKPISAIIKRQAKDHPYFRNVCVRFAQFYHRMDVRLRRRLAAKSGESVSSIVMPLDEKKAIELGASFIGETLIFGVAGVVLMADSARSHRGEQLRRKVIEDKFEQLFDDILSLTEQQELLEEKIEILLQQSKNGKIVI